MAELEYKFTNDILFKILFTRHINLLKSLVSALLDIKLDSIEEFKIINPEIPPDLIKEKFCRLDINMVVNGQQVDLEVQVEDEKDYTYRSVYYWARDYSSSLNKGKTYSELPRVIVISILDFNLFKCKEFHSEFEILEVTRHERLTDRLSMHFYELHKIPKVITKSGKILWLSLFGSKTEEQLKEIEALGVPEMKEAIEAFNNIAVSDEFREFERLRSRAEHNEASALANERRKEREKWQGVVAEKDTTIAEKDTVISDQASLIAELKKRLGEDK